VWEVFRQVSHTLPVDFRTAPPAALPQVEAGRATRGYRRCNVCKSIYRKEKLDGKPQHRISCRKSLVLAAISTSALAQSKNTETPATRDVRQLIKMMDKDQNGTVSIEEFMDF
jgi:hypothetical protein